MILLLSSLLLFLLLLLSEKHCNYHSSRQDLFKKGKATIWSLCSKNSCNQVVEFTDIIIVILVTKLAVNDICKEAWMGKPWWEWHKWNNFYQGKADGMWCKSAVFSDKSLKRKPSDNIGYTLNVVVVALMKSNWIHMSLILWVGRKSQKH